MAFKNLAGSITSGQNLELDTSDGQYSAALIQVQGTWASDLYPEATINGTDWFECKVGDVTNPTNSFLSSITANGIYIASVGGFKAFRIRGDNTGTANIDIGVNHGVSYLGLLSNGVEAVQSGTWNITNISGTVSLPTGASTEATLSTLNGKVPSGLSVTDGALKVNQQGFPLATRVDEASATVTYVGVAAPGTTAATAGWQIKRITVSGTVTTIEWADGNGSFDNIWNDRAGLVYS